jgi:hypothetical protein
MQVQASARAIAPTSTGKLFLAVDEPQRVRSYATRTAAAHATALTSILERDSPCSPGGIARDNRESNSVRLAAGIYEDLRYCGGLSSLRRRIG